MTASHDKPSRRDFLKTAAVAGAVAGAGCASVGPLRKRQRPNIVLIIDDQHNARHMGWTGQSPVKTPNIDRLASQSVCFTNAYATSPVCSPTRHTLYTGLYPSEHGVLVNGLPMRDGIPTFIESLNDAGYTTANIGKLHSVPHHLRQGFQYVLHHEFFMGYGTGSHYGAFLKKALKERGLEFGPDWWEPRPGYLHWGVDPEALAGPNWVPEDLTPEHWITDESIKFIRDQLVNRPDQPFFLHASYFPPHHPYRPITKYADMYDEADMKRPPNFGDRVEPFGDNAPVMGDHYERLKAHYFGFITQFDAEMGRLLDGLDELGLADNTIVIFMSDHGDMMGEHGLVYKGTMYEGAARVPFMVRWPGASGPRIEKTPITHADLMPTILAAAGLDVPAHLPGDDIGPLIAGKEDMSGRGVYCEYIFGGGPFRHIMWREGPYKLIATSVARDGQPHIEYRLFNVEDDPYEMRNLATDPEHASVFEDLQGKLMAQWERQEPHRYAPLKERPKTFGKYDLTWPADPWTPIAPVNE